jgi:hypothetical protein
MLTTDKSGLQVDSAFCRQFSSSRCSPPMLNSARAEPRIISAQSNGRRQDRFVQPCVLMLQRKLRPF